MQRVVRGGEETDFPKAILEAIAEMLAGNRVPGKLLKCVAMVVVRRTAERDGAQGGKGRPPGFQLRWPPAHNCSKRSHDDKNSAQKIKRKRVEQAEKELKEVF